MESLRLRAANERINRLRHPHPRPLPLAGSRRAKLALRGWGRGATRTEAMDRLNRDSPDDSRTGLDILDFPGSLQGKSAIRTATATSGSPDGGRGADLAIFAGIWALCVPKIRFCNIDGEGHQGQVVR